MTELKDFGVPGVGSGILHPAKANQFRVLLDDSKIIMMQVTKVQVSMVDRTITVHIEQPIGMAQEMLDEIGRLCYRSIFPDTTFPFKFPFAIELLDGNEGVHSSVSGFAHVVKHEFALDYATSHLAQHILTLRYTRDAQ